MERWVTTGEILQPGQLSEINLIHLVNSGELIAYDSSNFAPIDWHYLKEQFRAFGEFCEKEQEEDTGLVRIGSLDRSRKAVLDNSASRIPWKALPSIIATGRQLRIPHDQYHEIKKGWSNKQVREYLEEAVFKKIETEALPDTGNHQKNIESDIRPQPSKIDPRKERSNLLIIGSLLELLKEKTALKSDANVIQALEEWLPNVPGCSKRTLENRFALAKKALDSID